MMWLGNHIAQWMGSVYQGVLLEPKVLAQNVYACCSFCPFVIKRVPEMLVHW